MTSRDRDMILANLRQTLETTEFGYADFTGQDPRRRLTGLRNFVVFGRAVTNVVQTLKAVDPDFMDWYQPIRERLASDPVARYFYLLRSEILKEGSLSVGTSFNIKPGAVLSGADLQPLMSNPPPGATGFFIGDGLGGSGWDIETADGEVQPYYVSLPAKVANSIEHRYTSDSLPDRSVNDAARQYLDTLRGIVEETYAQYA